MSAGVSDQRMKGQGNQVLNSSNKHVEQEEQPIPWSQQANESYEKLQSPTTEGNTSGCFELSSGSGANFQNPPFNVRDGSSWSGGNKFSRKSANDKNDNEGNYGHQSYNNYSNNGDYNTWGSQSMNRSRKGDKYDDYYNHRSESGNYQNDGVKYIQKGVLNLGLEGSDRRSSGNVGSQNTKSSSQQQQTVTVQKKATTWASVASQPAKPTLRANSSSSTLKKRGSGIVPPPIVPGKHNMDIGTWETAKNGPILVPPTPPPVISVPIEPSPLSQTKPSSNNNSSSNNEPSISGSSGNISSNLQVNQKPQNSNQQRAQDYSNQNTSGSRDSRNNPNVRSSWMPQGNRQQNTKIPEMVQNQRPNIHDDYDPQQAEASNTYYQGSYQNSQQPEQYPGNFSPQFGSSPPNEIFYPPIVQELQAKNNYNPREFDMEQAKRARFFVIKSNLEDDIHRSVKYDIWCSTKSGNERLDEAYRERESVGGAVYLFFSANGSMHFCGMAQMISPVDFECVSRVWSQKAWKGKMEVKWIYIKDIQNMHLRHIKLENNEYKPITKSRDAQEVPNAKGLQMIRMFQTYKEKSTLFDDFSYHEEREMESLKKFEHVPRHAPHAAGGPARGRDFERGGYYKRFNGRDKNYARGGYHSFDNRRNDDHRGGGYDRRDGNEGPSYRDNSGDYHNRGFHRNDFNRRDDRGHYNRDRDNYDDGSNSGNFMSRGDRHDRMDRGDRGGDRGGDRIDRGGDRIDRFDRGGGGDRFDRGERVERIDRGDRGDRSDRSDRSDRGERDDHEDHDDRDDRDERDDRGGGDNGREGSNYRDHYNRDGSNSDLHSRGRGRGGGHRN